MSEKAPSFEEAIEQFESAWTKSKDVPLADFLPAPETPWYQTCLVELIRLDLEFRWDRGERVYVESYKELFPAAVFSTQEISDLAFEEYRIRYRHGDQVSKEDYRRRWSIDVSRWPTWSANVEDEDRDSRLRSREGLEDAMPRVGERFHGFELVGMLGSGAFGSVFLARQQDLASRFVALKVTEASDVEPFSLAQLQHTNIIPIYSLKRGNSLQSICMPFLGVATFRDLLSYAGSDHSHLSSGKAMIGTVTNRRAQTVTESISNADLKTDEDAEPLSQVIETWKQQGASVNLVAELNDADYLGTVLWMISRIADGLAYAHSRGVVHGDLKPANILIGDDAEPKILDFHLAHASTHDLRSTLVGGTLPYMSAEHLRSYDGDGQVDTHCDLFSLGVIFYESITGKLPYPTVGSERSKWEEMLVERQSLPDLTSSSTLRRSPAIASMIAKCLAPKPEHRYRSVDELKVDLDCHRKHLPLVYAPNVSWLERGRKWIRRHPKICSLTSATIAFALLAAVAAFWVAGRLGDAAQLRAVDASEAFVEELEPLQRQLLGRHPSYQSPQRILAVTDQLQTTLDQRMGSLDDYRQTLDTLPTEIRNREIDEYGYSQYLLAYYRAHRLTAAGGNAMETQGDDSRESRIRQAVEGLDQALAIQGDQPAPLLVSLKAELLGKDSATASTVDGRSSPGGMGQNDELLHAVALVDAARLDPRGKGSEAIDYLSELIGRDPGNDRAWLLLGRAYSAQDQYDRAEVCYTTAAKLAPSEPWSWVHRGIDRLDMKRLTEAESDLSTAIKLDSQEPSHYLNRALARIGQGKFESALEDLDEALQRGAVQTRVHLLRSQTLSRLDRAEDAAEAMSEFLKLTPVDETSWIARGMAHIRKDDAKNALADFEAALRVNPRSITALQNIATVQAEYLNANEAAIEAMGEIVALKPNDLVARVTRGVLFARQRNREQALADATFVLSRDGSADTMYRAAGVFSLLSSADDGQPRDRAIALDLLAKASLKDPVRVIEEIYDDPDLNPVRELPPFKAILDSLGRIRNPQKVGQSSHETKQE